MKHLSTLILSLLFISFTQAQTATAPAGSGTSNDPYQIATLDNLYWLSQTTSAWAAGTYFIQTTDINATNTQNWDSGAGFSPIGNFSIPFSGNYNGQGHIISSLFINRSSQQYVSIFGYVTSVIKNLGMENVSITGPVCSFVAGLVGYVHTTGSVSNCYSSGNISGSNTVGGFCGYNNGTITNSYSTVNVTNNGQYSGGFVARNQSGTIINCYATGTASATSYVGGFDGYNAGTITNSFWDSETSGYTYGDGGTPKTTAQMQTMSTFTDAGWDFQAETINGSSDIWGINSSINGGYPFLAWQYNGSYYTPVTPTGDGSSGNAYQIATLANLYWVTQNSSSWSSNFIQTANIDAAISQNWDGGKGFLPIGNNTINFKGHYNGQSHTINNLTINRATYASPYDGTGLFGNINGSTIDSVGVENVNIHGGHNYVGGLVGSIAFSSIITNSYSTGSVSGNGNYVGGLVGENYLSTITNCYSIASVTCSGYGLGGLVGFNSSGTISNCYSTGSVSGGSSNVGGLVGGNNSGTTTNSFWDTQTSGQSSSVAGGTGKTTAEMKTASTFTDAGWDFQDEITNGTEDIWGINPNANAGYPVLSWQGYINVSLVPVGSGTESDPYQITTLNDLKWLSQANSVWSAGNFFIQTADINAGDTKNWDNGYGFVPIGNNTIRFAGHYNGQGHTIDSLKVNRPAMNQYDGAGLFGTTDTGSVIENVGMKNVNIYGYNYVGGLVGYNNGTVTNCYSTGSVRNVNKYLGGLIGTDWNGTISNSYSTCSVNAGTYYPTAGLVGYANYSTIINCYSAGSVVGSATGGLVVVGNNSTINNSFWDTQTSGQASSDGGTGKTTLEMKTQSTFTSAGWDFTNIWSINSGTNNGYPYFQAAALGVNEYSPTVGILIYAFGKSVYIQSHDTNLLSGIVTIYNILGMKVYQSKLTETTQMTLNTNLPKGVYFINLSQNDGRTATKKVFVGD